MQDSSEATLKNIGNVKRIQILTWAPHSITVQSLLQLVRASEVNIVEVIPLQGNTSAIKSVLAVTERSRYETYLRIDESEKLYRLEDCDIEQVESDDMTHKPEYRVLVSGTSEGISKPVGITFLDKVWEWPDLFSNLTDALGMSMGRAHDDLLVPKEILVDSLRDTLGISDGMEAEIMLEEMSRVGILEEVEFELYRFRYHDPKTFYCLNWSGRSTIETAEEVVVDRLIPHLVALANRIASIESREYIELLNYLDLLRKCAWSSILELKSPKLLLDLHYVMKKQLHFADHSYERKHKANFFYEFADNQTVFAETIRNALIDCVAQENLVLRVTYEIVCELGWTLTGIDEVDQRLMIIACDLFCAKTSKLVKSDNVLYLPRILKFVIQISPFREALNVKISNAKKISFYDLVLSVS